MNVLVPSWWIIRITSIYFFEAKLWLHLKVCFDMNNPSFYCNLGLQPLLITQVFVFGFLKET